MISTTVGKVSVTPQGSWSGSNTYTRLDIVTNDGCSYIAKQDVPENIQLNNTEYWIQLASKGKGITSITKTSTSGLIDTYTIIYSDYSTSTFDISNGNGITNISLNPDYTLTITTDLGSYTTASIRGETGAAGATITSITKTSTSGLVDTYTVALSDGRNTTFTVTNGSSISTISKTSTSGLVDTYTVSLTDGSTSTFTVTNGAQGETGNGIASITKTSTSGLVDTYTILYTNGTSSTFTVTNGAGFTPQQIDKLDSLPDATGVNGTYIITETSGEMTLSPDRNVFKFYGDFVTPITFDGTLSNVTSMSAYQAAVTAGTVDSVAFVAHTTLVVMSQNVNIGDLIFTSFFIDTSGYPHFETIIDPTLTGLILGTDKLLVRLDYNSQTSSWTVTTAPIPSFESTGVTGQYVLNDNAGILTLVPYKRAFVFAGDVTYNTVTKQLTVSNVDNTYEDFVTGDFENIDNILFSATLYTYDNSTTTEVGVFSLPLNELLSEDEKLYFRNIVSGTIFNLDNFVSFDVILNGREETPSSWVDIWISSVEEIIDLADTAPLMNGVAAPGVSTSASRSDHVHPSDTTKANVDGQYENLASGKLIPRHGTVDNAPYLLRPSFSGDRELDKLVGGTVVWNQLVQNGNFADTSNWSSYGTTFAVSDNVASITVGSGGSHSIYQSFNWQEHLGHKLFVTWSVKGDGNSGDVYVRCGTNSGLGSRSIPSGNTDWYERKFIQIFQTTPNTNYLYIALTNFNEGATVYFKNLVIVDLTAMFGSTIADYIYSLEQNEAGSGIAGLRSYGFFTEDYIPYDSGTLKSVEATAHEMVGFNLFDKSTVLVDKFIDDTNGEALTKSNSYATDYIQVIPSTRYYIKTAQTSHLWGAWYDADKNYISGITTYANTTRLAPSNAYYARFTIKYNGDSGDVDTFCINLSNASLNGTYKPYDRHTYPLDDIVLRGIPKLNVDKLYYDGDEYSSDGTVKRKYGIVDLGDLTWTYIVSGSQLAPYFMAKPSGIKVPTTTEVTTIPPNARLSKYTPTVRTTTYFVDKTFVIDRENATVAQLQIKDSAYTDKDTFKAAMSGVYLVYELATPTTETADPFTNPQIVDADGTETYTTTNNIPVGHETEYIELDGNISIPIPPDGDNYYLTSSNDILEWSSIDNDPIREKVEYLPDLASTDGTYLISQTSDTMSLVSYVEPDVPDLSDDLPLMDGTTSAGTGTEASRSDHIHPHDVDLLPVNSANGNPISINDGFPVNAKGLSASLSPIQDLHGYESPWPAGGGKNKLNPSEYVSGHTYIDMSQYSAAEGQTINLSINNGTTHGILPKIAPSSGSTAIWSGGACSAGALSTYALTLSASMIQNKLYFINTSTYEEISVEDFGLCKFQLEISSSKTPYAPYENICPISGHSEVSVVRSGNNIWDEEWELGYLNPTTGANAGSNNCIRSKNYTPIIPNTAYYYRIPSATGVNVKVYYYDANKSFISLTNTTGNALTSPSNAYYVRFYMSDPYGTTYNNDIAINYPSTVTTYSPHNIVSISIPLGQTVYGGTVDVVNGKVAVNKASVNLADCSWNTAGGAFFTVLTNGLIHGYYGQNATEGMCSCYKRASDPTISSEDNAWVCGSTYWNGSVCWLAIKDTDYNSPSDFQTSLTGQTFVYTLATPIEVTLTPQQLMMLLGDNVISSAEADSITLDYYCDITNYIEPTKKKVETLPDVATNNGTYLITQTDNKMSLTSYTAPTVPTASTSAPKMNGTAAAGTSSQFSRGDHVHPSDTTKANVADIPSASSLTPTMNGTASAGSATTWSRGDHVHPSDTSKADVADIPTTLAQLSDDSSHRLVTDTQITNWGTAYSNSHTHSNKSVLDGITADKVSSWDAKQGDLEEGTDYLNTTHLAQTYVALTSVGANSGVAELDANGKVPSSQLPSFVDDVLEYNSSSAFPATGESGKIYIAKDTSLAYRWGGSGYAEISPSLALGETSSTAYRGDRGKTAYDHSQDSTIHVTTTQKSNWDTAYTNNHTHVNKTVLDDISSTDVTNWGTAYTNNHTHSNKALLDTYEQTETNLADAVTKKHSHSNKTVLDGITSTNVTNWGTAYTNSHTHSNKAVLDDIASTDITAWNSASADSHTHSNKTTLDGITSTNVTNWGTAYTNSHTHSNKTVLDGITSTNVTNWGTAYTNSHTHSNKSVLDDISSTDVTAWNGAVSDSHTHTNLSLLETYTQTETDLADAVTNSHTHTNKTVLDGITSTNVTNWGTAYTNSHTHSNKTTLDGISSTDITNWNGKQKAITYGTTDPSGGSVGDIYIKYTT